jgi:hypothetical protein
MKRERKSLMVMGEDMQLIEDMIDTHGLEVKTRQNGFRKMGKAEVVRAALILLSWSLSNPGLIYEDEIAEALEKAVLDKPRQPEKIIEK